MEDLGLLASIDEIIAHVSRVGQLNGRELGSSEFPDRVIASFHNHIGNIKQYVSDEELAFNAAEQFLSLKSAINEVQAAIEDIFLLHHKDALAQSDYRSLEQKLMAFDQQLRRVTDLDYTHE